VILGDAGADSMVELPSSSRRLAGGQAFFGQLRRQEDSFDLGQLERNVAIAEAFDQSWSHMLGLRDWWPSPSQVACSRIWRQAGSVTTALASSEYRDAIGSSLRRWRAFRGARYDPGRFDNAMRSAAPLLHRWEGTSILTIAVNDVGDLHDLFAAVRDIKPTERKWVVTSKALHHLLPDLIVPMDNRMTAPFLGRGSLPTAFDSAFLVEAYAAFLEVIRNPAFGVGARRIRAAGREVPYPVAGSTPTDNRVGLARVVDFAVAGFILRNVSASIRDL
jgi:hypothetical protein